MAGSDGDGEAIEKAGGWNRIDPTYDANGNRASDSRPDNQEFPARRQICS